MAIIIDGKEMSKAWHYDMCIQHWNDVAENGIPKWVSIYNKKYDPQLDCFACEYHNYLGVQDAACNECPFHIFMSENDECFCQERLSPYEGWRVEIYEDIYDSEKARQYAIEIAQLFIDHYPEED